MNVLFLATECFPFASVGGLAHRVSSLAKGIEREGHSIKVFVPRYGCIDPSYFHIEKLPLEFKVNFGGSSIQTIVYKGILHNSFVNVFFIESQNYFSNSKEIYLAGQEDKNRFNFFIVAALELMTKLKLKVDLIHLFNLDTTACVGFNGIPVVSNEKNFSGIISGIDEEVYNPETDTELIQTYSKGYFSIGKKKCKEDLLEKLGLENNVHVPLLGMVSRLTSEKGLDLLIEALPYIAQLNVQFVILGKGDEKYEKELVNAANKYKNIKVNIAYDHPLSRKIYAASDFFINPSKYEPAATSLLIAMKYGCVPIVYVTGRVKDIVVDIDSGDRANGITFVNYSGTDLLEAINRAMRCYKSKETWAKLVKQAMSFNSSSSELVKKHIDYYKTIVTPVGVSRRLSLNT